MLLEKGLLHGDCMTVTGKTMAENLADVPHYDADQDIVMSFENPIKEDSHLRILYGNLAPTGAVAKMLGRDFIGIEREEAYRAVAQARLDRVRRFDRAPKPMSYQPEFLDTVWQKYLSENNITEDDVDPDAFIRWTYAQALAHRQPRYEKMAARWGITVQADDMARVRSAADFETLIADALAAG